ncbi:MAG: hypothetical protein RJQ07_00750 [Pseudomonadales bacterium]
MTDELIYDRLAKVLQDVHERFPEDGFSKHQRLRGLLADHLPGADREIRIALDAIDEGVIRVLTDSPPSEMGMQIDRLVTRLDTSRGIREDIARQIIQAFAFALGSGGLPSTITSAPIVQPNEPAAPQGGDDWVGVSEVAQPPTPEPAQPSPPPPVSGQDQTESKPADATSMLTKLTTGSNRYILIGIAVVGALFLFSQQEQPAPQPGPGPQPSPQPSPQPGPDPQPNPGPQPNPNPGPQPIVQPNQPERQNPGPGNNQQPGVQQMWYDNYGGVWSIQFAGSEFQGYNSNTGLPARGIAGMIDQQSGAVVYQLFDDNSNYLADGQGQYTDQTHISFQSIDGYGNVVGQGQMHINHRPQ